MDSAQTHSENLYTRLYTHSYKAPSLLCSKKLGESLFLPPDNPPPTPFSLAFLTPLSLGGRTERKPLHLFSLPWLWSYSTAGLQQREREKRTTEKEEEKGREKEKERKVHKDGVKER